MKRISKKITVSIGLLILAGLLILIRPWSPHPMTYSAEAIEAWVVDAETKQPIEGVIVTTNWELHYSTLAGRMPAGQLKVMETVTDKTGRFYFPKWGPKIRFMGYLDNRDPQILLFRAGYEVRRLLNPGKSYVNESSVRRSIWQGKRIELKVFSGDLGAYAKRINPLRTLVDSILYKGNCEWQHIPEMMKAIDKQKKIFKKHNIYSTLHSIDRMPEEICGSPSEYFGESR